MPDDAAMTALERANAEQRAASDPARSAFVAASAGSGKTKLLTDRLLRLMLADTRPERILCLTYTKAAAAEMMIRLNRRLGEWVAMPPPLLAAQLKALDVVPTQENLRRARKLFGDVLELPGGMRIETIHAFCASLLRRFPVEANLSPHFRLEEGPEAASRLREARERVVSDPEHLHAVAALAGEIDENAFVKLIACLNEGEDDLHELLAAHAPETIARMQYDALGAGRLSHSDILRTAIQWPREPELHKTLSRIASGGTNTGRAWALDRLAWLAQDLESRFLSWVQWVDSHFTVNGERRKMKTFTGAGLKSEQDFLHAEIDREHDRIERVQDAIKAARLAALNEHLLKLARPIIARDLASRAERAELSYGDLISRTGALLQNPGAAWILYKLDGGIDHLLLDEVQDTAPAQWKIANAIAEEFFAGAGAVERPRSIFAVGDAKQSIFSFQGADLRSFEQNRGIFARRVRDAGASWLDGTLSVSFRSTAPILQLADAVFAAGAARDGVVGPGEILRHGVSRQSQAGSVSLWPLSEAAPAPPAAPWTVPEDYASAESSKTVLAREIAAYIQQELQAKRFLPSRGRALAPGDFLILVARRDAFVAALTRELKRLGIPVSGVDRMILHQAQAVADLLALCDALLLPEDDLAFAHYLASPLGDLSDESLMRLAVDRRGPLHAALAARHAEQPDWRQAHEFFSALRSRVDFIPPYALLSQALAEGGRARLLARLGPEAAEPIEELLAEALAYAGAHPLSLQGFVFALRHSGAEIKREAEAGGDLVRIMTVHGAKGLQAPLVILPDTTSPLRLRENLFWLDTHGGSVPIFCPRAELRCDAVADAIARDTAAKREERNRLLYVALTRAEDVLIICGAKPAKAADPGCWYEAVRAGFERLGIPAGPDGRHILEAPQTAPPDRVTPAAAAQSASPMPGWAGAPPLWNALPPRLETARPEPLAPSRNTEDEAKRAVTASPLGENLARLRQSRAAAMAKGRAVHALLQHLPEIPAADRPAAAQAWLDFATELAPAERAAICGAVLAILDDPALQPLFGPGSRAEAPIAGIVGEYEIGGMIDRLAIGEGRILVADYKTDRRPPERPEAIPAPYLRQLAAYRALLAQIHPAHEIACVLIWTQDARAMPVPPALLQRHAPLPAQPYPA